MTYCEQNGLVEKGIVVPLDLDGAHAGVNIQFVSHQWLGYTIADPNVRSSQPRITFTLNSWYWVFLGAGYQNVRILYAKRTSPYKFLSVFLANPQRFEGSDRDPGPSRASTLRRCKPPSDARSPFDPPSLGSLNERLIPGTGMFLGPRSRIFIFF